MTQYSINKLAENIFAVGVKDWNRKLFDALIPLPHGTTYNAYLVKGNDKTALIDTVQSGFEKELHDKINQVADLNHLDYLIMNHAEPDHAGSIPYVLKNSNAKLIANEKGAKAAQLYYLTPQERIIVVKDGDTIDLGGKTLRFLETPMIHWPETMVTYCIENKIVFPCDFFGAHTAFGFYDDENETLLSSAKSYFGEIMMPFRAMCKKALEKIKAHPIEIIAPSHGCVYRNPSRILELYEKWVDGKTAHKAILVYVSMWNSTKTMIDTMAESLLSEKIEVSLYNLVTADLGEVAKDLVDSRAIVLGTPTVLGGMHPVAIYGSYLVKLLKPPLQYGAVVSSYGWGPAAIKQAQEILGPAKIEIVGAVEVNGPPTENDLLKVMEIGKQLASKIKSS